MGNPIKRRYGSAGAIGYPHETNDDVAERDRRRCRRCLIFADITQERKARTARNFLELPATGNAAGRLHFPETRVPMLTAHAARDGG